MVAGGRSWVRPFPGNGPEMISLYQAPKTMEAYNSIMSPLDTGGGFQVAMTQVDKTGYKGINLSEYDVAVQYAENVPMVQVTMPRSLFESFGLTNFEDSIREGPRGGIGVF